MCGRLCVREALPYDFKGLPLAVLPAACCSRRDWLVLPHLLPVSRSHLVAPMPANPVGVEPTPVGNTVP